MRFLAPGFLHLAWLLAIPVVLYLYRRQARRLPVSTLLFFRLLAREHQEAAWLRKLKRWLSLLLALLMLLALMLALGRPVWSGGEDTAAVVLVVDRSASMAARDAGGQTRLDEARQRLRRLLAGVPDTAPVTLVAADARAEVLLARSRHRRECLRALAALETLPVAGDARAALRTVAQMAALEKGSVVWWATDRPLPDTGLPAGAGEVKWLDVALRESAINVGITAFQVRALPLERDRLEGFLQVSAAAANPGPVVARLEVQIGGRLAQLRELELEPDRQMALVLPLEGADGQLLEARVIAADDCLGWDDAVAARLPAARALRVAWYAEQADPFTELAFQSLVEAGRIEMWKGDTAAFPPADLPDVFVFENWLPESWPEDRPVIALRPPRAAGPLRARVLPGSGLAHPSLRVTAPGHPVLHRVAADRLEVTQSVTLELAEGLEPLWMAGDEPLLAAGEARGRRLVVAAFLPSQSRQLALLPAFPLLLGNALLWCADDAPLRRGLPVARTGELLERRGRLQWTYWDGVAFQNETSSADGWLTLNRIGAWSGEDGDSGMSLLASAEETDLPARLSDAGDATGATVGSPAASGPGWTAVRWLLAGFVLLLLLESWLFHRQAVY